MWSPRKRSNQAFRSSHHLLHPPLWVMMTPVIGFTLGNNNHKNSPGTKKNESIMHNSNALSSGFRQTHIYSERQSELDCAVGTLLRCFIEFVRLFPSLRPSPFLYLLYPSHRHTHRHTNKLKMMGFSLHPWGRVDPCTRLNLTLTTSSDRGRKYHGWERGGWWELNGAIRVKRGVQWLVWSDRLIRPFLREALFSYLLQNIRRPNSTLTLTSIDYIANTHTSKVEPYQSCYMELTKSKEDKTDTCV